MSKNASNVISKVLVAASAVAMLIGCGINPKHDAPPKAEGNPCATEAENPCAAPGENPCAAPEANPCAAPAENPCTVSAPNPCSGNATPYPVAAPKDPCPEGTDPNVCRENMLADDDWGIGWLKAGLTEDDVAKAIGTAAPAKGQRFEEGASGEWIEEWTFADLGIAIEMSSGTETGPLTVRGYTVNAPFDGKTVRGIGVGSTKDEVKAAYGESLDPERMTGDQWVAGSVYGGIFLRFENDAVVSIFVGAGAE